MHTGHKMNQWDWKANINTFFIQVKIIFILTQQTFSKDIPIERRSHVYSCHAEHIRIQRRTKNACVNSLSVCPSGSLYVCEGSRSSGATAATTAVTTTTAVTVCRSCIWKWDCCCHFLVTVWHWCILLLPARGPWTPAARSDPWHPEPRPAAATLSAARHTSANTHT